MTSLTQWQQAGRFFTVNGNQIFYRTEGDEQKPALVLIHGFPTCSWDWVKIWPKLAEHFHVITLDMLGFGFSDKPVQEYSIFQQADIFDALLNKLAITKFHILAHDYGDTVAQELLARHGDTGKLLSVVFSNGGLFPETHKPVLIQKLLLSPLGFMVSKLASYKKFTANFGKICAKPLSKEELTGYWNMLQHNNGTKVMHKLIHYMTERKQNRSRWVGALQNTTVPMLLIDGLLDPISGAHMVERYQQLVSNANVVKLADTGHYPQVESPAVFVRAALAFLQKQAEQIKPR